MKKTLYIVLAFILLSCISEEPKVAATKKSPNGHTFNESLKAWNELKQNNGNSYQYEVQFESWIGNKSKTKIKVVEGKVSSRSYEFFKLNSETGKHYVSSSYVETKDDLGKHEEGAQPATIDQLYESCLGEYIIADTTENYVYFETNKNGIINLCGYVPKACADDCYEGVSIDNFSWR